MNASDSTPGDRDGPSRGQTSPGERRQMTVMFCDIVGSTRISESLDPEQTREILLKFQDVAVTPVRRYDGYVAQYLGDGLLVYFGYPRAHEDAARRALLAGLEVAEAVRALSPEIEARFQVTLGVRVGVHTGEVVVGDMRGGGTGAIGPTPNIAARLQEIAAPNTVVTSSYTRGLTEGYFEFEDLGAPELKGVSEHIAIARVVAPTGALSRLETAPVLVPLVGRETEAALLERRWSATAGDQPVRPLFLLGEPGIGKSRLVQYIRTQAGRSGGICLEGSCSPYQMDTPFFAIARLIEHGCGIFAVDGPSVRLDKLERQLRINEMPDSAVPVLATLLSIPLAGRYEPPLLSPEAFRALAIDTLAQWFDNVARQARVLLIVEDLHWADDSTLQLLGRTIANRERSRCFILVTSRTEIEGPPWNDAGTLDRYTITPLAEAARAEMLDWLLPGQQLPDELQQRLIERSNGVPLFLEELARMYGSSADAGANPAQSIPSSLRDLLAERLESPGVDKELAQVVASIGIEAPLALVEAVTNNDRDTVLRRMQGLIAAGLIERNPGSATESCSFRHALVRDSAYMSQLRTQRVAVHGLIVDALARGSGGEAPPEVLGLHSMQAERWQSAASYYIQAGTQARGAGAEAEAIRHFTEALHAAEQLPEGPERDGVELMARLSRIGSYTATVGYAAAQSMGDLDACFELCRRLGPSPGMIAALAAIWAFHMVSGDYGRARPALDEARQAMASESLAAFRPQLQTCLGYQFFYEGRLEEATRLLEEGSRALLEQAANGERALWTLPNDPAVAALALEAASRWYTGQHESAKQHIEEALSIAEELPFPVGAFSLGYAAVYGAWISHVAGEYELACRYADRAVEIGSQYGFGFWTLTGAVRSFESMAQLCSATEAEAKAAALAENVAVWRAIGGENFQTGNLTSLACAYRRAGQPKQALDYLDEALREVERRGERFHEAEIHRLRAEVLLDVDPSALDQAAEGLIQAIEVAKSQGARSFQLRAAASLRRVVPFDSADPQPTELLREAIEAFPAETRWAELEEARAMLGS